MGSSPRGDPALGPSAQQAESSGSVPPTSASQRVQSAATSSGPATPDAHSAMRLSSAAMVSPSSAPPGAGSTALPELTGLRQARLHISAALDRVEGTQELAFQELELVRDLLVTARNLVSAGYQQQRDLQQRFLLLEQKLSQVTDEAQRERAYVAQQHDTFIAELIEDHENRLLELRTELDETRDQLLEIESSRPTIRPPGTEPPPVSPNIQQDLREELNATRILLTKLTEERERSREALLRLQQQRDDAQLAATRLAKELDETVFELDRLRAGQNPTLPSPNLPVTSSPPGAIAPIPRRSSPVQRTSQPNLDLLDLSSPPLPAITPLAEEVAAIVAASASENPPPMPKPEPPSSTTPTPQRARSSRPAPFPQKPHPSTRPLIGYSVAGHEIAPERVESGTTPPRSPKR